MAHRHGALVVLSIDPRPSNGSNAPSNMPPAASPPTTPNTLCSTAVSAPAGTRSSILDVQETLNEAREIFTDHPALPHLIAAACSRVASKWEGNGDDSHEARRWAIEIAEDYAAHTNIKLIRWTDVLPPE